MVVQWKGNSCTNYSVIAKSGCYLTSNSFFFFLRFIYLFMRDTQRERQRHSQREEQAPRREPNVGLNPRSWDHALSQRQALSHWATQVSRCWPLSYLWRECGCWGPEKWRQAKDANHFPSEPKTYTVRWRIHWGILIWVSKLLSSWKLPMPFLF